MKLASQVAQYALPSQLNRLGACEVADGLAEPDEWVAVEEIERMTTRLREWARESRGGITALAYGGEKGSLYVVACRVTLPEEP